MRIYRHMIREETGPVETRRVTPLISNANPAVDLINQWLTQPFELNLWSNATLTTRAVQPRERMSWMQTTIENRGLVAHLSTDGIARFLAEVNLELGPNADLRLEEAAGLVRSALERGDQSVWLVAPRKQLVHVVEPGDTFEGVGDKYGVPTPKLAAANPSVQQNNLIIGEHIVIPAQSDMMPILVDHGNLKHIEVDLKAQRLHAYDGATGVLTATISSGIPKWRTLSGIFQVQGKQSEAYIAGAHVRIPNWLTIYDLAEPGSMCSGIHALPILQNGSRLWNGYLGKPVSLGCIVMGIGDSDRLYEWADVGTPVVIHGTTPASALNYDDLVQAQRSMGNGK